MDREDVEPENFDILPMELQNTILYRSNPQLPSELGKSRINNFRLLMAASAQVQEITSKELKLSFDSSLRRKILIQRNLTEYGNSETVYIGFDTSIDFYTQDTEYFHTISRQDYDGILTCNYYHSEYPHLYGLSFGGMDIMLHPDNDEIRDDVVDLKTLYLVLKARAKSMGLPRKWVIETFNQRFDKLLNSPNFQNFYDLYLYLYMSCGVFEFEIFKDALKIFAGNDDDDVEQFPYYDIFYPTFPRANDWILFRDDNDYITSRIPEMIKMIRVHVETLEC